MVFAELLVPDNPERPLDQGRCPEDGWTQRSSQTAGKQAYYDNLQMCLINVSV